MSRTKSNQTLKRDNLVLDFIRSHKGVMNCVSRNAIASFLSENGFEGSADSIHGIVLKLIRKRNVPICSVNTKGYYWAANQEEIKDSIADLRGRIEALQKRIDVLNTFIVN